MTTQQVNLQLMRNTVRRMSGRYVPEQMVDSEIDRYINLFMTLHLPLEFKNIKLTKPYVFLTTPNVDTYNFLYEANLGVDASGARSLTNPGNVQISPPVFCQGYVVGYYQDKGIFYNRWPKLSVNQQLNSGQGPGVTYTGIIPSAPFLRAQVDIKGNVVEPAVIISAFDDNGFLFTCTDTGANFGNIGSLIGGNNVSIGFVNYLTGEYQFTVPGLQSIPEGVPIYFSVVPYQSSRPTEVLFYNQQIVLRPVPQQVYQMEFQISQQPTDLIDDEALPELAEWYLFICAGAAKLIYTDFPDPEGMEYLMPIWQEQKEIAQRRTLRQLSSQRAATIFSVPNRPFSGYFLADQYSGSS